MNPIKEIHQHLVGLHLYSVDRTRAVPSQHFCSASPTKGVRQCIIYDSEKPNARLIGIEYVIDESVFESLPQEEKQFWHSHKYEVEQGLIQLGTYSVVPGGIEDLAEQATMKDLHTTYGKTIHTWNVDEHSALPLGPPSLMMANLPSDKLSPALISGYEKARGSGGALKHKAELRAKYLDTKYEVKKGADAEKGIQFEIKEVEAKKGEVVWKGEGEVA
ncbi:hypothetical protein BCR35DRAFT_321275 [Leucosporidium creatinivorum]|uniref:DUF1264-domain-containing protein n=1 Tax=Leucosporidium creatinivorum TaxID=106004 RepID=A0A1Y2FHA6_9BASI|nr:hypothetical protein BCR35DRAFT_321275 [Leucosporidium creatinivorum]